MFLRKLHRRGIWLDAKNYTWLHDAEVCGDVLGDLKTEKGSLSVWKVEEANLDRVIAAVAATKSSLENFDMILFSESVLERVGASAERVDGKTPDVEANTTWHFDIVELTTTKLAELAVELHAEGSVERRRKAEVKVILKAGLENKSLDQSLVDTDLATKLR